MSEIEEKKKVIFEEVKPALEMLEKSYELFVEVMAKHPDFYDLFEEDFHFYFREAATDQNPLNQIRPSS